MSCMIKISILTNSSTQLMGLGLYGAALLDLTDHLNAPFKQLSYSTIGNSVVICATSMLGKNLFQALLHSAYTCRFITAGIAFQRINRQLAVIVAMAGEGIILLTYPFQHHVYFFYAAEMVNSFFGAIIDVAVVAWMLDLWPEQANTFLLIMSAVGAVGGTVSPFLVTPFLSVKEQTVADNVTNGTSNGNMVSAFRVASESRIVIPYSFTAAVHLIAAISLVALFFKSPFKQQDRDFQSPDNEMSNTQQEEQHHLTSEHRGKSYETMMMIAGTIMYIFFQNAENNCLNYLPQFLAAVVPNISKQSAALMGSTYFAAYALTFGITIFVSTKVRVIHMLYAHFILIFGGNLLLAFYADTSVVVTWMAVILLGAGHSGMSSGIYSFLEEWINMNDRIVGIMLSAATITMMLNTLVLGQLVEFYPFSYVDVNLVCISLSFTVLIIFTFSMHKK